MRRSLNQVSSFQWIFLVSVIVFMSAGHTNTATSSKIVQTNTNIEDLIGKKLSNFKTMIWDPTRKTTSTFNVSEGSPLHIILSRKKKGHCEMFHMKFTDLTIVKTNNSRRMIVCVAELKDHRLTEKCHWINNTDNLIVNQGNLYGMPKDCGPWYLTVYVHTSQSTSTSHSNSTELAVEVSEPYDPLFFRWFRVVTNLAFIPGILVAFKREYYAEGIVYLSTFALSSTYHLCESELHCFKEYDRLHVSDIYCSDLSIIVTIWAMTGVKAPLKHIVYLAIAIMLQFAVTERSGTRYQLYINLVFAGLPSCYLVYKYVYRSIKYRSCYPSRRRWAIYLIPGFILGITGALINQIDTGSDNYYYVHCIWHLTIMLSVAFLLPLKEDEEEEEWFRNIEDNDKSVYITLL